MDSTDIIQHDKDLAFAREQAESDKNIRAISMALGAVPTIGLMARLVQASQGYKTGLVTVPNGQQPSTIDQLFRDLKDLIDQEIQSFIQGFVTAEQLAARLAGILTHDAIAALGFVDNAAIQGYNLLTRDVIPTIEKDIQNAIVPLIPQPIITTLQQIDDRIAPLINPVINDVNGVINSINTAIDKINLIPGVNVPKVPKVPPISTGPALPPSGPFLAGPFPNFSAAFTQLSVIRSQGANATIVKGTDGQYYLVAA